MEFSRQIRGKTMQTEQVKLREEARLDVLQEGHDGIMWNCHLRLDKFDDNGILLETVEREGNLLVSAGATYLFKALRGDVQTAFDNTNAFIGVGDSTTAAAIGQTDLQAATNKFRAAMVATFPLVGVVDGLAANQIQFKSSYATGEANFAWQEWGIFNASTAGTMLNRKVENLGTKTAGVWTLTLTLSLA